MTLTAIVSTENNDDDEQIHFARRPPISGSGNGADTRSVLTTSCGGGYGAVVENTMTDNKQRSSIRTFCNLTTVDISVKDTLALRSPAASSSSAQEQKFSFRRLTRFFAKEKKNEDNKKCDLLAVFKQRWQRFYICKLTLLHTLLIIYVIVISSLTLIFMNKNVRPFKDKRLFIAQQLICFIYFTTSTILFSLKFSNKQKYELLSTKILPILTCLILPCLIWIDQFANKRCNYYYNTTNEYSRSLESFPSVIVCLCVIYQTWNVSLFMTSLWSLIITAIHLLLANTAECNNSERSYLTIEIFINLLIMVTVNGLLHLTGRCQQLCRARVFEHFDLAVDRKTNVEFEKERQDQLLLSIIPIYLTEKVKKTILNRTTKTRESIDYSSDQPKMFQDMYVQQHDNVSILYADIVNFTVLTTLLTPAELVRLLNELYTRFDTLAQEHHCMRIKILGDCYYCVSGIPYSQLNHADHCVRMGLAMISEIKGLIESTGVDVDMRIGIHSGSVLCGIMGLIKWQYDIWSDDVTIANLMESEGQPGKLHVTKATLQQLSAKYLIEPVIDVDPRLKSLGLERYFILPFYHRDHHQKNRLHSTCVSTRNSYGGGETSNNGHKTDIDQCDEFLQANTMKSLRTNSTPAPSPSIVVVTPAVHKREKFVDFSTTMNKPSSKMTKLVEGWGAGTPFSNLVRRRSSQHMRAMSIQLISNTFESQNVRSLRSCCRGGHWTRLTGRNETGGSASAAEYNVLLQYYGNHANGTTGTTNFWTELMPRLELLILVGSLANFTCGLVKLMDFNNSSTLNGVTTLCGFCFLLSPVMITIIKYLKSRRRRFSSGSIPRDHPLYFKSTFISVLVLISGLIFLLWSSSITIMTLISQIFALIVGIAINLSFLIKLIVLVAALFFYTLFTGYNFLQCSYNIETAALTKLERHHQYTFYNTSPNATLCTTNEQYTAVYSFANFLLIVLIVLLTVWMLEYENKMSWDCLKTVKGEHEDIETMRSVNAILLKNILPDNVAEHFLQADRDPDSLYYQKHTNVCVMFASIPNFKDFWSEWDFSKKLECLRFLNEIVCDFDKLLQKPKFISVEKIKTVGSTYMAATGLRSQHYQDPWRSVKVMVEYAFAIMTALELLNKDAFQNFQLRIGLSYGPVIAGVVAAQKPQYDIFGNTVNLASRMDSHGEMGKIHATSETAQALKSSGYEVDCRGFIKVKGVKEKMETYFIIPPPDRKSTFCDYDKID